MRGRTLNPILVGLSEVAYTTLPLGSGIRMRDAIAGLWKVGRDLQSATEFCSTRGMGIGEFNLIVGAAQK